MKTPPVSRTALFAALVACVALPVRAQEPPPAAGTAPVQHAPDVPAPSKAGVIETPESAPVANPVSEEDPDSPATTGFKVGKGFKLMSEDGQWSLRVGLQAGYRLDTVIISNETGSQRDPRAQFYVLRPRLDGTLFKEWIRFWTSFELASNPPFVVDSYIEAQPWKIFAIRLGQFWSVMSRHEQLGPQEIVFPEWSFVSEYYWPGRDKGVEVYGTTANDFLTYDVSLTGGSPNRQFSTIPGNWVVQAVVRIAPLGKLEDTEFPYMMTKEERLPLRMLISASGWAGKIQKAEENFNPSRGAFHTVPTGDIHREQGAVADFTLQTGFSNFYAEGWFKRTDPLAAGTAITLSSGAWGQYNMAIIPKKFDFAVQGGWIDPNLNKDSDNFIYGEGEVGYYVAPPYVVLHLRYGLGHQDAPTDVTETPSLPATPGWNHEITFAANVYF